MFMWCFDVLVLVFLMVGCGGDGWWWGGIWGAKVLLGEPKYIYFLFFGPCKNVGFVKYRPRWK